MCRIEIRNLFHFHYFNLNILSFCHNLWLDHFEFCMLEKDNPSVGSISMAEAGATSPI